MLEKNFFFKLSHFQIFTFILEEVLKQWEETLQKLHLGEGLRVYKRERRAGHNLALDLAGDAPGQWSPTLAAGYSLRRPFSMNQGWRMVWG